MVYWDLPMIFTRGAPPVPFSVPASRLAPMAPMARRHLPRSASVVSQQLALGSRPRFNPQKPWRKKKIIGCMMCMEHHLSPSK